MIAALEMQLASRLADDARNGIALGKLVIIRPDFVTAEFHSGSVSHGRASSAGFPQAES
jgi:hypothetical protein